MGWRDHRSPRVFHLSRETDSTMGVVHFEASVMVGAWVAWQPFDVTRKVRGRYGGLVFGKQRVRGRRSEASR